MEKVQKIWLDGKFVNWSDAKIHILTHSLHYGGGVFEGIRAYKTKTGASVFRLSEHIDRLFESAKTIEIKIPFTKKQIKQAVIEIIKVNKIQECYIRPIVFLGYGKMGLNPKGAPVQIAIAVWPWNAYLGDKQSISAKISKYIRPHPKSTEIHAKICGHYVNSILTSLEAQKAGFDEAILLDYQGYVAEGPGENIFIVKNNTIFTPNTNTILAGITRDTVIQIAKDQNIKIKEKNITIKELKSADEAFFCGTAVEICSIEKIDNIIINKNKVGKITQIIKENYNSLVRGENKKYLKWLTFVKQYD